MAVRKGPIYKNTHQNPANPHAASPRRGRVLCGQVRKCRFVHNCFFFFFAQKSYLCGRDACDGKKTDDYRLGIYLLHTGYYDMHVYTNCDASISHSSQMMPSASTCANWARENKSNTTHTDRHRTHPHPLSARGPKIPDMHPHAANGVHVCGI